MPTVSKVSSLQSVVFHVKYILILPLTSYSFFSGPAWTREESIESAQNTFYRLLSLTLDRNDDSDDGLSRRNHPDQKLSISFDVLRLLASDENGEEIPEKVNAYSRLFRPDLNNEVTELAFVQSCDQVYRSLRYFRASVGNAR